MAKKNSPDIELLALKKLLNLEIKNHENARKAYIKFNNSLHFGDPGKLAEMALILAKFNGAIAALKGYEFKIKQVKT